MSNVEKNVNVNTEKKDVVVSKDVRGELTYEDKVIQKIIGLSLERVPGLLHVDGGFFSNLTEKLVNTNDVTHGVNVEVGKEQVAVDLNVIVEYRKNVPTLYKEIKEQHEADSVSLQDRVTDVAESTGEFASEQLSRVKSGIGSGVAAAQEKLSEGAEFVQEKVGQGVDNVKDAAAKAEPRVH